VKVIVVLSGGVGAARLLRALRRVTPSERTTAVVNVGDDLELHGLVICPDLDTVTYTLAGLNNETLGWGLNGESWRVMSELEALGGESWFRLGDRDLATHLYRTQRLHEGATKALVTQELTHHFGVTERLLPVTNDSLRTRFITDEGELSFQEYFVAHHHDVVVRDVVFAGAPDCRPTPGVLDAIASAERVVIAPSNPLISIEPILRVPGVRDAIAQRRDDVVAVSPIIAGAALKGPADRLLRELGHEATALGVANYYRDLVGTFVIDEADDALAPAIRSLDMDVRVTTTVMADVRHATQLAKEVIT
jgi:LPPG:FO 2-phospho-L-lactate transferase